MRAHALTTLISVVAALVAVNAEAQEYSVTNLGTLPGGTSSYGYGINDSGQVTGYSNTAVSAAHAFLYSNGVMQDLGTLGGTYSYGYGINDSGQVTGAAQISGNAAYHAFLYSNGTMQDLGTLGGTSSSGSGGINDSGQVAGWAYIGSGAEHAFLYSNSTMQDLGTLGGTISYGTGINASGQVTGSAQVSGNAAYHAFIYSNRTMQDLGTLGGTYSYSFGINASGQVTGYAQTSSDVAHAFLYSNGTMQDLGTLPGGTGSWGQGINDSGQVTGYATTSSGITDAILYSDGQMVDLNSEIGAASSLYALQLGQAINDNGQILVVGYVNTTGQRVAFLLTPIPQVTASAQTVMSGQSVTLSVTPTMTGPYTCQWYQGVSGDTSSPIAGATSCTYTTPVLSGNVASGSLRPSLPKSAQTIAPAQAGQTTYSYWVQVISANLTENSATITITVSATGGGTDVPLPAWALVALGAGLLGFASRRIKQAALLRNFSLVARARAPRWRRSPEP